MEKIILISQGLFEYSIQLANALSKYKKVTLILLEKKTAFTKIKKVKAKANLFFITKPRIRSPSNILMINRILKLIKSSHPHTIHFQGSYPWYIFLLPCIMRYQIVTTIHDVSLHPGENKLRTRFSQWLMRHFSKKIIVHSPKLKVLLKEKHNCTKTIYSIPHGNYQIYETKKNFDEQKNWLLFFGRIWEYKGLDYLIKAEPLITKKIKDFKIVIAGRGEDFSRYEKMIKNKDNFIIYNKFIPEEQIPELFQKSSIVVLPYIEASQSGVIPVAYQFKKPVIATDVGALSDVVKNNETGLLIPPKDRQKLADAIVYLLKRPELRKKMGEAGYKFAQKELSWEKIAEMTINAYKDETPH